MFSQYLMILFNHLQAVIEYPLHPYTQASMKYEEILKTNPNAAKHWMKNLSLLSPT